ncbi:peptidoglycan DD-metalloendopeptidase family protein [Agaribacterium haliotis]|uniref:peptidoglycan DD-metalloendopeptidase family protein n=1 Tax=Agaribacterium haliotis TaxID=2013869 RepID=UPI000BB52BE0|nr:peptidoglycan DD-metalloendopeptidase family protein [Agaribacterium haliotis]
MELVEKLKKSSVAKLAARFPHGHLAAAGGLSLSLIVLSAFSSNATVPAERQLNTLELPKFAHAEHSLPSPSASPVELETSSAAQWQTRELEIKSGDTLSSLFKRAGLSDREMMNFLSATENKEKLNSVRPGHKLKFSFNDMGSLEQLRYISSKLQSHNFTLDGESYRYSEDLREPDIKVAAASGIINSSLYLAGTNAGMDDKLIMEFAEVFGWDIDFALDIRRGDSFRILYEEHFVDGEKLRNGPILSAEFINQGQAFNAVRYVHQDGRAQYYTPEGRSMQKAFLRAPVDFRRISSNFNPRRLHPITGKVRPHRGIDYAAKTGTPVWSSGDGKVIKSGYSKYNGNYVVIQHGGGVQTKYLHLHKRKVKTGQRVRQKQLIGTVGSTGLSSGPHLHYEFLLNGVHRNPRTIVQKLPKAEAISTALRADFERQTSPLVAQLEAETATLLALNDSDKQPKAL